LYKHGYSKVTDQISREIRHGRINREQGLILEEYYFKDSCDHIDLFCNWLNIDKNSLQSMMDFHRNKKFWKRKWPSNWEYLSIQSRPIKYKKNQVNDILKKLNIRKGRLITTNSGRYGPIDGQGQFIFGDPRGSENPDLASIQTLFIREHNWHVNRLSAINPAWSGEQLYQRARSIVIAEIQNITFKEWLPKVVGESSIPEYTGFKTGIDGTTQLEFAVAAMRFGHSIVSGALDRINEQGVVTSSTTLAQAFFMPAAQVQAYGGADAFIRKLCSDVSNKLDVHIIDDLRNLLNDPPAALDLAAVCVGRPRVRALAGVQSVGARPEQSPPSACRVPECMQESPECL
jgi:hypothetical protein